MKAIPDDSIIPEALHREWLRCWAVYRTWYDHPVRGERLKVIVCRACPPTVTVFNLPDSWGEICYILRRDSDFTANVVKRFINVIHAYQLLKWE